MSPPHSTAQSRVASRVPSALSDDASVPSQPLALTVLKLAGVVVSSVLLAALLFRLFGALAATTWASPAAWVVLPALLLGYLLADMISGTAHWFCDTFFSPDTPLIGKVLIQPFRDHHDFPGRITRYRFLEQDTSNFFILLPPLALATWTEAPQGESWVQMFCCCALLGLAVGSFFTNLFHKWAHQRRPPAAVRWLQRRGLILSPERHAQHHRDHSRGFCVTSGWMNPLLDRLRFFSRIEGAVRSLQGALRR